MLTGELDDTDIDALTEICKSAYGLACEQEIVHLGRGHLPGDGTNTGRVNVHSIFHKRGVNALAENQTLNFGPGLTVVYGDNAAGKSGYIRIFKSACRTRGTEDILGNVLSGTVPLSPIVSIKYTVSDGPTQEWTGGEDDESIARVSVFDRYSEAVYTTQKTDVVFRPFGLDLFDMLSKACASVRLRLEREQHSLGASAIQTLDIPENSTAAKFVARLSSLTSPDEVKARGTLSEDESERLALIEKQLLDLQTNDPAKIEQEMTLRGRRLGTFAQHLSKLDTALSPQSAARSNPFRTSTENRDSVAVQFPTRPPTSEPGLSGNGKLGFFTVFSGFAAVIATCFISLPYPCRLAIRRALTTAAVPRRYARLLPPPSSGPPARPAVCPASRRCRAGSAEASRSAASRGE